MSSEVSKFEAVRAKKEGDFTFDFFARAVYNKYIPSGRD
jgi:hypothetical protein